jgi:tetratricopeptide (TPR) repeat protein
VRGCPTAFVIDSDGAILARLSGSLQLLPMKLRPYLAEDRTEVVTGDARTVASRQLQSALKLLDEGKPADARKVLDRALEQDPNSTALRVAMIRVLIELHESKDAMARLRSIAEQDLKAGEREILASQIYASADRWDEAKAYAKRAIELNATSPEAHIQLGRVLEHEGNLKEAIEEYRTGNSLLRRSQPSRP